MQKLWRFFLNSRNQKALAAVCAVAGLIGGAVAFFWHPAASPDAKLDCSITANQGQAACGDIENEGPVTFSAKPTGTP